MADFVKVGGLGEVSSALPRALRGRLDMRVLLPGYRHVLARGHELTVVGRLPGLADIPACDVGRLTMPDGLTVYVLLCPELYERDGTPYADADGRDWPDNDLRFARLSLAAAEFARGAADPDWHPGVLHLNDWPAALAAGYLRWFGLPTPTIMTIHNLAYQGGFARERLTSLGIPERAFDINGVEFYGQLSFLKAGLFYATHLTTVSPTYAREITTAEFGCGFDGLLRGRAERGELTGILNSIDESWDPKTDQHLEEHFAIGRWKSKGANAAALRRAFGLAPSEGPLFAIVSRLVHQKGVDLAIEAADAIIAQGGQIVVTGRGEGRFEGELIGLAARRPGSVGVNIGFDERRAHRMYAGSDFLLMPSRFEPCGLSQMYAQRFGSLPIAHRTGGLADTIEDGVTGFLFGDLSTAGLVEAVGRAFQAFCSRAQLNAMRRAAMRRPLGWAEAALAYQRVYMGQHARASAAAE
ncbi:glycogen synthase GlgA [Chelatococcus sp. GCM10030263]|uniref:glycogen synthase GlgA n=1 Tax=Chelatococcus sp. GCM10030263 TaxID=3273387 RepID=UPI00361453A6